MTHEDTSERATQNRVIKLFQHSLNYEYLGNWQYETGHSHIEEERLRGWLKQRGYSDSLISKALHKLGQACALGGGRNLYDANKAVYSLLRYGVKVKEEAGAQNQTVWLIDWEQPQNNQFGVAEEVSIKGKNAKRPDIVLYVNGLALGVIELKRSSVSIAEGIRQNLDNQNKDFIRPFFTTMQLVMAGNDSEGLRYGTIETPEKHYYNWREAGQSKQAGMLDMSITHICEKSRFLELVHNFIVFDAGVKKLARHNQYFGIKAAQHHVKQREGGIIWHTQGSGKSLTMVWLAKWIRENTTDARVLLITDRTELDSQIEGVFNGVDEEIYRTKNGHDLISKLNEPSPWLICSLVHKFGRTEEGDAEKNRDADGDAFIDELKARLPSDFAAKGNLFVFVDECHRTQSGKLHNAMKQLLPNAMFIGFTGTPLLKQDKDTSMAVFGSFIHKYKYDEAVADKVVLDLRYEARDIDQYISSPRNVDEWFDLNTQNMTDSAKSLLKKKWGTMQKILSSKDRQAQIAQDILMDMLKKPRLMDGNGNAMLVCASVYQACTIFEMFNGTDLEGKCAIITSYQPTMTSIKGEDSGAGQTEKINKYKIYRKMLADYFEESEDEAMKKTDIFETQVKKRFLEQPGQMKLLIVVDKLLTGFDAPSATYLYIDKTMKDHGLFQAICRVNRLDGDDKDYGYIIDYKDLFQRLEGAIGDYTNGAFDDYDPEDVKGLLGDRLKKGAEVLELAREKIKALCEPVLLPKKEIDYFRYFCGAADDKNAAKDTEPRRILLYKCVSALVRAFANIANEMEQAGYSTAETEELKQEAKHFVQRSDAVKRHSGDYVDMKKLEPAMRLLIDRYVRAEETQVIANFDDFGLVELIVNNPMNDVIDSLPEGIKNDEEAMSETIEANMRRTITDEHDINPEYYEKMSVLLDDLIQARKQKAMNYKDYLQSVKDLCEKVNTQGKANENAYPATLTSGAMRALYDNLNHNEGLVIQIDQAIRHNKEADWIGNRLKERKVSNAIRAILGDDISRLDTILALVKNQPDYK